MGGPSEEPPGTQPLHSSERSTDPQAPVAQVEARALHPGTMVGRFTVLRLIGSGGMGVVYAAVDPELGRTVALKLLRGQRGGEAARTRLLREAQAMARLSHPNVAVVYETGTYRDEVFVAMEYIEGTTLADWLSARRRPWRETLAVFLAAGRGLAAAHAAGLIHRDFKPANVLLDDAGRPRVVDFGLARAAADTSSEPSTDPMAGPMPASTPALLTLPGDVLGTPAYMAPEQRAGGRASLQSDLYSYCVSLYEGLYGERPPIEGPLPPSPRGSEVPAAVRRVLVRGLGPRPAERWPSMTALLAALDSAARPSTGRIVGAASVVLLCGGLVAAAKLGGQPPSACGAAPRLAGIWDDGRRDALRAAFAATGKPFAAASFESASRMLDRYTKGWVGAVEQVCRTPMPEATRQARSACLDQRLQNLAGVLTVISVSDENVVARAPDALAGLEDLAVCGGASGPAEPVPADPSLRQRVQLLRARIAASYAMARMGRYSTTTPDLVKIRDDAQAAGYRPLEAEALSTLAYVYFQSDEHKRAEESLYAAREAAEEVRYDMIRARIWRQLAYVYNGEMRYEDGRLAAATSRAILKGLGPEGDWERISLDVVDAYNMEGMRRYDEALALARRALAGAERMRAADDPNLGPVLNCVGYVLSAMGRYADAEAYFQRVLDLYKAVNGETSAAVAKMVNNLGTAAYNRGDHAAALARFQHALEIKEKLLAPDNLGVGYGCLNVGEALHKLGRDEEALRSLARARDILTARLGPDKELVASVWHDMGEAQLAVGDGAAAAGSFAHALEVRETAKAPPADVAETRFALARTLWESDRKRAKDLAASARVLYATDKDATARVAEVDAWLASRK